MGVSINISVFIQMIGFLILLLLLNIILYKPILSTIRKRREEINSLKEEATRLMKEAKQKEETYNTHISVVEEEARKQYEEKVQKAFRERDKLVSEKNAEIREKLVQEEMKVEISLRDEMDLVENMAEELSKVAFSKVVGK